MPLVREQVRRPLEHLAALPALISFMRRLYVRG